MPSMINDQMALTEQILLGVGTVMKLCGCFPGKEGGLKVLANLAPFSQTVGFL